ncbi:MAG: alpha/beta hydrolase [Polyangiales bacterium]
MRNHHISPWLLLAGLSVGCADALPDEPSSPALTQEAAPARLQDGRVFTVDESRLPFEALPGAPEADRYWGVLPGPASYRVEVPKNWNGVLVLYAHGYAGTGPALNVGAPSIRAHLLAKGYAWAASSYSKNYYDVRAGVEDTNALALAFNDITEKNGRKLDPPKKRYIIGHSMGGHVAGAAVEREAEATAKNKVHYAAALPMCGVMGDVALFDYFGAYQVAAQHIAGPKVTSWPVTNWATEVREPLKQRLWEVFPSKTTALGDQLRPVVAELSGGARPLFDTGFANLGVQSSPWNSSFGGDGTIAGILTKQAMDTRDVVYQLDADRGQSAAEQELNRSIFRLTRDADANPLQPDGVRWIPAVNGEFDVPVVTLHTLGDLFVPLKMQQIYRERATAKGSVDKLVQRVIRGVGHCEFTLAEQASAFDALVAWEERGEKPKGDEILDPKVVAAPDYGCAFTDNTFTPDETARGLATTRGANPACPQR